jgi:hypothetical protein
VSKTLKPWTPGTFSTEDARVATHEAQAFLLTRASELRINNKELPFADLHEHYAGAIAAYVDLLENGLTAHRATIKALETALAAVNREIAS